MQETERDSRDPVRPLIQPLRILLYTAATFVFIAGIQLFVLTRATDTYFAWTIASHMTAAFLGASYLASCLIEASRPRRRHGTARAPACWRC